MLHDVRMCGPQEMRDINAGQLIHASRLQSITDDEEGMNHHDL